MLRKGIVAGQICLLLFGIFLLYSSFYPISYMQWMQSSTAFIVGILCIIAAVLLTAFSRIKSIKETAKTLDVIPPPPESQSQVRRCPNCKTELVWLEQYKRWYCPNDKEYIP